MIDKSLLPYLYYFWQVAKCGSFTRAAHRLNVGQSAVSYQVKLLEERLGKRLFDREKRADLRLTPPGELLARRCDEWFEDLQQTLDGITGNSLSGDLCIAGPTCFGSVILLDVLTHLRETYPSLRTHLRLADEHIDLREERVDLAIRTISHGPGEYSQALLKTGICVVASASYAARHGLPETINELKQHNMILTSPSDADWQSLREHAPEVPVLTENVTYIDNALSMLQAVKGGLGLCYLPQYLVEEQLRSGELIEVMPETLGCAHLVLYLCSAYKATDNPKVEATIAALKKTVEMSGQAHVYQWLAG